jgi:hypothetical protein
VSADRDLPAVVKHWAPVSTATLSSSLIVPAMVADAGDRAARRLLDFFAASIENDNTRMAHDRAASSFFAWLGLEGNFEAEDVVDGQRLALAREPAVGGRQHSLKSPPVRVTKTQDDPHGVDGRAKGGIYLT